MSGNSPTDPHSNPPGPIGWVRSSVTWVGVAAGFVAARRALHRGGPSTATPALPPEKVHSAAPPRSEPAQVAESPPSARARDDVLMLLVVELAALDRELVMLRAIVEAGSAAPVAAAERVAAVPPEPLEMPAPPTAEESAPDVLKRAERSGSGPRVAATLVGSPVSRRRVDGRLVRVILETTIVVVAAFLLAMLIQLFLVKPFFIPSESMVPTLQKGDRVLVNRLAYQFGSRPQRGDVVVFLSPVPGYTDLIKRVVAVAGDRVEVREGKLWIDGQAQVEPYVNGGETAGSMSEQTVPAGDVFVMGDNRNDSADSRVFGAIGRDTIVGKALAVYWPLDHFGGVTARTEQVAGTRPTVVQLQSGP